MAHSNDSKASPFMLFFGILFILVGIYAGARSMINYTVFSNNYPMEGVLSFNFSGANYQPWPATESDCLTPQSYYTQDGKSVRLPTQEEKDNEKITQKSCLDNLNNSRKKAQVADLSQTFFFLLLGSGLLITRKVLL